MSGLIYFHDKNQTVVAVDTLAVNGNSMQPSVFTSKCSHIHHLNLLTAGVGSSGMVNKWTNFLRHKLVGSNPIKPAKRFAQKMLTEFSKEVAEESKMPLAHTESFIYTFGYDNETERMSGFQCKATKGYEPVDLGFQIGYRPDCVGVDDLLDIVKQTGVKGDDYLFEMMKGLALKDREENGLYTIGGNVLIFKLKKDELIFRKMGELPGFDELGNAIMRSVSPESIMEDDIKQCPECAAHFEGEKFICEHGHDADVLNPPGARGIGTSQQLKCLGPNGRGCDSLHHVNFVGAHEYRVGHGIR